MLELAVLVVPGAHEKVVALVVLEELLDRGELQVGQNEGSLEDVEVGLDELVKDLGGVDGHLELTPKSGSDAFLGQDEALWGS